MLSFRDLVIPHDWPLLLGVDTGTYMSGMIATVNPDPYSLLFLQEYPNYRYVGGALELLDISNRRWAEQILDDWSFLARGRPLKCVGWVDVNSQFKVEIGRYGIHLMGNRRDFDVRVDIFREYVHAHDPARCWLAPWLSVLPYEMEHATWPDEHTTAGSYHRLKQNDHTLDCAEHIASRRPQAARRIHGQPETFLQRYLRENRRPERTFYPKDRHLGDHL